MKISAAFMLFAAHRAHNMNEPLMYVWLCFNNIFCRFLVRGRVGNFPLTTAHNAKIKQHTVKWRVNEKIIVQFQVLIKISWFLLDNRVIICRIFTWLRNFFNSIHFCYFFLAFPTHRKSTKFSSVLFLPPRDHTQPEVPRYPQIMANQKSLKLAKNPF